jgi:acyl-CoA synthetase (NDP forming)
VLVVDTLVEMADTLELLSSPRRVTEGRGISSILDSGGERAMFVDVADDLDVPMARISDATRERIQAELDPGVFAENPLDAWGTGIDADRIFRESFLALHDDPDTAAVVFAVDLTVQGEPYDEGYVQVARDVFSATTKPFCFLSHLPSAIGEVEAAMLRADGIPVLEGTVSGLLALKHLIEERDNRARAATEPPVPVAPEIRERWLARLSAGQEISELEGLELLSDYGVPVIDARAVEDAEDAVAEAEAFGYPVVMKTAAPGIQHKSDVGGVKLGLDDAHAVREAYTDLAERLGPQAVVAATAPAGIEVALGVLRDPTFGPLVLVAAGGVLVELLQDRKLAFPPLDDAGARRLIDALQMRPMLDGLRGAEASDVNTLAQAISRLSVLAADLGEALDAIDVNPVIVSADGCVAVDALVIPRSDAN